jgi:hypothetical protein
LIAAISADVGVRISYAQKRLGAVFADSKEERDARLALAAVHPAVRQTINPHATLSIAAQTIRLVDCTPHHHLLCYRPAASMPQVLVRGMDLLTRQTWRHDLHTREEPARPRDKHGPSGHNLNIPINPDDGGIARTRPRDLAISATANACVPVLSGSYRTKLGHKLSGGLWPALNLSYLGDTVAAPAEEGVLFGGICTQTSLGFGANAWSAHSASRSARRCGCVKCGLGTVTAIFPWSTILMALRASGVQ